MRNRAPANGRVRRIALTALEVCGVLVSFICWTALSGAPVILIVLILERG